MKILTFAAIILAASLYADGEKLWLKKGQTEMAGGFLNIDKSIPRDDIKAYLRRDDKNLYIAFKCVVGDPKNLKAAALKNDDLAIFGGDVIEVGISPDPKTGVYYHFAVNPAGAIYSAKKRDVSWEPKGVRADAKKTANGWTLDLTIPFAALGVPAPDDGAKWAVNLASAHPGPNGYSASWSGASNYHRIEQFGTVVFGGPSPANLVSLENISYKNRVLTFSYKADISHSGRAEIFLNGKRTAFSPIPKGASSGSVSYEISDEYIPLKSITNFSFSVSIPAAEKSVVFAKNGVIQENNAPLLEPDKFYYFARDGKIRFKFDFSQWPEKSASARISLVGDGKRIDSFSPSGGDASGEFPLDGLAPGKYELELTMGKFRTTRAIMLLDAPVEPPPISSKAALSISGGKIMLGGKPVFLFGLSPSGKYFLDAKEAFNLKYGNVPGQQTNGVEIKGLPGLKYVRALSGYVIPQDKKFREITSDYLESLNGGSRMLTRISYEAQMRLWVADGRNKPAPLNPSETYRALYKRLKQEAPDRIFTIHIDRPSETAKYIQACDIFETAYWSSSYARAMLPKLNDDMISLRKDVLVKPVIFWLGGTIPNNECRTAEEIRAGAYLSIIHNIQGNIIHMGHGYLPRERSRLWSLLSHLNPELQAVYADFSRGAPAPGFVRNISPGFAFAARRVDGKHMLIIVNLSGSEKKLRLGMPGKSMNDVFGPYEPKVYYK